MRYLAALFVLIPVTVNAQPMGLLGVAGETQAAVVQPPAAAAVEAPGASSAPAAPEDPRELERALWRARDDLKRARERSESLARSIADYAPGAYWDRYYRAKVADYERQMVFAEARVKASRSAWQRFKRFMNTDIISGQIVGDREDLAADSSLRRTRESLEQARAQVNTHIPEGYARMRADKQALDPTIPGLEAALAPLEAKRHELNARGIKVLWDDKVD